MSTKEKYPNANTSAERLAEIEDWMLNGRGHSGRAFDQDLPGSITGKIRDLLAMLHKRSQIPKGDEEFWQIIHSALGAFMKDREADEVIRDILFPVFGASITLAHDAATYKAQLHEQRWRKCTFNDEVPLNVDIQFGWSDPFGPDIVFSGKYSLADGWYSLPDNISRPQPEFWRPIPPLPKE